MNTAALPVASEGIQVLAVGYGVHTRSVITAGVEWWIGTHEAECSSPCAAHESNTSMC
jgi:hypothetical protein